MTETPYIHLRTHSSYSLAESTLKIKKSYLDQIFKSKKILFAIIGGLILFSTIFLLI